jgi:hypothetical protein
LKIDLPPIDFKTVIFYAKAWNCHFDEDAAKFRYFTRDRGFEILLDINEVILLDIYGNRLAHACIMHDHVLDMQIHDETVYDHMNKYGVLLAKIYAITHNFIPEPVKFYVEKLLERKTDHMGAGDLDLFKIPIFDEAYVTTNVCDYCHDFEPICECSICDDCEEKEDNC